jgi:hypothetical protein
MKTRLLKLAAAAVIATVGFGATTVGTASAGPCSGKGGMIFAQSSGEGADNVVQVWCANGESFYLD